jgi:Cu+-exporting ATPase
VPTDEVLALAAAAERYSEHPLAEAVRQAAGERGLALAVPEQFESVPGLGVRAQVNGQRIAVGNRRMIAGPAVRMDEVERQGKTLLVVARDDEPIGVLAAADTLRPEVPAALAAARAGYPADRAADRRQRADRGGAGGAVEGGLPR